jgi:large subunit ribosomal protein L25
MSEDVISLALEPREVTGKAVKHLRTAGTIPAVVHDHGKPSLIVQADGVQLLKVWRAAGKHHPVQLSAAGQNLTALIKVAEFDPRKHRLTHVVFNAVRADEKVEAEVPIHPKYDEGNESSPAERAGFIVLTQLDAVMVEAIPSKLPDVIYFNAEKLVEVGDSASVEDLIVPDGVEVKTEANHAVATVYEPSALAAANEDAGGDAEEPVAEEDAVEEGESEAGQPETEGDAKTDKPQPASAEAAPETKHE